jgi:hypothetical protein
LLSNDVYFSGRSAWGCGHCELGALLISDEAKSSQGSHRARAPDGAYGITAHLRKIQPITDAQADPKRGRGSLIWERTLDVRDDAVVVCVKTK